MGREQPISGHVELGAHGIVPNYFEQNQVGAQRQHTAGYCVKSGPLRYYVGCAHHHEHSSHRQITVEYLCIVVWSMVGSGLLPSPDAERSIKGRLAKPREGMVRYIPA